MSSRISLVSFCKSLNWEDGMSLDKFVCHCKIRYNIARLKKYYTLRSLSKSEKNLSSLSLTWFVIENDRALLVVG